MTSTARHLSPRALGTGRVAGRRAADEGAAGQVPVCLGAAAGPADCVCLEDCGLGCSPGQECLGGGVPSVPAVCHAIRRPRSWASTARPGPGRPQRLGSLQPAPPSRRPLARVPGPGPAGALTEAPSRPHTPSLWPGFPQMSWPLAVDLGSQPHPSFTLRTWWRAPAGFGALSYP